MEKSRIPNRLIKYRRLTGLSQRQVAKVLGMQNTGSISLWENGLRFPGTVHLFQLSLLYKTQPAHLYFDLWQALKEETMAKEQSLLAQHESIISEETYLL